MKVTVTPKVVGGTNRGGEDLFLVFEATGEVSDSFVVEPLPGDPDWDCDDELDPEAVWSVRTAHYGFEWSGTLKDLAAIVAGDVTNPRSWEWWATYRERGSTSQQPQKRFRCEHFVAGNAD